MKSSKIKANIDNGILFLPKIYLIFVFRKIGTRGCVYCIISSFLQSFFYSCHIYGIDKIKPILHGASFPALTTVKIVCEKYELKRKKKLLIQIKIEHFWGP